MRRLQASFAGLYGCSYLWHAAEERLASIRDRNRVPQKKAEPKHELRSIDPFDFDTQSIDSADPAEGISAAEQELGQSEEEQDDYRREQAEQEAVRSLLNPDGKPSRTSPRLPSTTSSVRSLPSDEEQDDDTPASHPSSPPLDTQVPYASIRFAPRVRIASGLRVPSATAAARPAATSRTSSQLSNLSRSVDTVDTFSSSLSASLRSSISPGRTWLFGGPGVFRRTPSSSSMRGTDGGDAAVGEGDYFSCRPQESATVQTQTGRRRSRSSKTRTSGLVMTPVEQQQPQHARQPEGNDETTTLLPTSTSRDRRRLPASHPVGILCRGASNTSRTLPLAYGTGVASTPESPADDDRWRWWWTNGKRVTNELGRYWNGIQTFWGCGEDDDEDDDDDERRHWY